MYDLKYDNGTWTMTNKETGKSAELVTFDESKVDVVVAWFETNAEIDSAPKVKPGTIKRVR